jgi:hypothetical protein
MNTQKGKVIQMLQNWAENAILCAEMESYGIDSDPNVKELRKIINDGFAAGMTRDAIEEWIWYPYICVLEGENNTCA